MFRLLVILFVIKLYAHTIIFIIFNLNLRSIILNLLFMVIFYVSIMMQDPVIILLFSDKSTKFFVNINTFLNIN